MTAVINSGPLIVLAKLNHLHLLHHLYQEMLVPQAVYHETVTVGHQRGYPDADVLRAFLLKMGWSPLVVPQIPAELANAQLGQGEREAIALAQLRKAPLLIDDSFARSIADDLGVRTVGSLGILTAAYRQGLLTATTLDELLLIIESRKDIWIDSGLCKRVRREVLRSD
jgi:predicted nucleic acid-binding protein